MSEKLKIVYRPLQELSPYAHNARTHSTEQVAQLVESIKQFGWTNPVLIDEKGEIIAGHGRVMAAEMLKMDSVPVIVSGRRYNLQGMVFASALHQTKTDCGGNPGKADSGWRYVAR